MSRCAGIVLAGGRSARMGSAKAALPWHGSTLVRRVTGIVARAVDGPVVVVRAAGQNLPALDPAVAVVQDARPERGPLEGLAAGLAAIADRAELAFVSSTDVPLLHPVFVRYVVTSLDARFDVALPEVGGYRQPLAAAYRTGLLDPLRQLIASDRLRPAFLFERCRVRGLNEAALRADPGLARVDPALESVSNLNRWSDYQAAHARPAPEIEVRQLGAVAAGSDARPARVAVRAWTLGELAGEVGVRLDYRVAAELNGNQVSRDRQLPLVAGDAVAFTHIRAGAACANTIAGLKPAKRGG